MSKCEAQGQSRAFSLLLPLLELGQLVSKLCFFYLLNGSQPWCLSSLPIMVCGNSFQPILSVSSFPLKIHPCKSTSHLSRQNIYQTDFPLKIPQWLFAPKEKAQPLAGSEKPVILPCSPFLCCSCPQNCLQLWKMLLVPVPGLFPLGDALLLYFLETSTHPSRSTQRPSPASINTKTPGTHPGTKLALVLSIHA